MTYELALELKNAGFALDTELGFGQTSPTGKGDWLYGPTGQHGDDTAYAPTLTELIEALGEDFDALFYPRHDGLWRADASNKTGYSCTGATPEEAVARLWLALNKKR